MKKFILIILLACVAQVNAQTNVYHPFPTSAQWLRSQSGSSSCCLYYYGIESGDTLINTFAYKKLYEQQGNYYPSCGSSQPCFTPSTAFAYIGALRQDSAAKKIYCITGTTERLLYDFNLQVGSIIQGTSDTVKKVDSMLISGTYHKRFFFFDTTYVAEQSYWVEGVGSSGGLFAGIFNVLEGVPALMCFNSNAISPPYNSSCSIELAGVNQFTANNYLKIYPNPAQNNFIIEVANNDKQTLNVFDVNGKLVLSQTINGTTTINTSNLNEGIYNVSITSNEAVINKRIVIVR